jgi:acetoacetate decarboxylase
MSNLEKMLSSHDPETVRLALTVMGYKENEESFYSVSDKLIKDYGLLLYILFANDYTFNNISLFNYSNDTDIRLKL